MKVDSAFHSIYIGDIGDIRRSFGAIIDAFDFCYVGDVIYDDSFPWCFNDFLYKICVRTLVDYFPCICASVKYLK